MKSLSIPVASAAALVLSLAAACGDPVESSQDSSSASSDSLSTELSDETTTSADGDSSTSATTSTTDSNGSSSNSTSGNDSSDSTSTTSSTCGAGQVDCAGQCIDPLTDAIHCGASGTCIDPLDGETCRVDQTCQAGACACPADFVECDGKCINPLTEPSNCGASGNCLGANAGVECEADWLCDNGVCVDECKPGEVRCDGICIDPMGDFNYCGAQLDCLGANKGMKCAIGDVCVDGVCQEDCLPGQILCGDRCVNPWNDPEHCGAVDQCMGDDAGKVCEDHDVCVDGMCELNCRPWQVECDGICINPSIDPKYCGATDCANGMIGEVCQAGEKCSDGKCVEEGCGEFNYEVILPPSDVMLVLDKSGSMRDFWSMPTIRKWSSLYDIVEDLTIDYADTARFGIKFFPRLDAAGDIDSGCEVDAGIDLAISDTSNGMVVATMPARNGDTVAGGTPTREGLFEAVKYMGSLATDHPKAIMLLTDGQISDGSVKPEDNCYTGQDPGQAQNETIAIAGSSLTKGIKVHTVGIGLTAAAGSFLDKIAAAGGTTSHIEASNAAQLKAAMESILAKISTCVISLDPVPERYDLLEVTTKGGDAPWLTDYPSCAAATAAGKDRGFVYTKLSGPYDEIELCGVSCTEYKDEAKVSISLNCPPPP